MKCKIIHFILRSILFITISSSQSIIRGPYLQIGTPNSIVIRWRTDTSIDSRIRYGLDSRSLDQWVDSLSFTSEHAVTLTGLVPDTKYYYSVETTKDILSAGPDHFFLTAPPIGTKKKSRIWILGDSGTADANANSVKDAYYNFTDSTHTDLWVMLGDNAYDSGTDSEYQAALFDMYSSMLKKSVLWPAFGNHDGGSANSNSQTGVFYDIFTLPTNAEAGGFPSDTEAYYSFDYANIHFICLNSHDISRSVGGAMYSWLEDDLKITTQEWVIAFWHHPAYSKGSHDSDIDIQSIEMRGNILPILERGGADLVFYGHSHNYERSYLIDGHYGYSWELSDEMILDSGNGRENGSGAYTKPSSNLAPHEGTVYFTAGSSGSVVGGDLNHPVMYISQNELGSLMLDIEGSRANITFLDNDGDSLDYLTLYKGPPLWSDIPDTSFYEDSNFYINLNDYVTDDGDPDSTLKMIINGNDKIIVNIDSVNNVATFSSLTDSSGFSENINIIVTDPWGAKDSTSFTLNVNPVQDAPHSFDWISTISDTIYISQSNLTDTYDLKWSESKDVDGDTISYMLYSRIGINTPELIYDTTVTALSISYKELLDNAYEPFPMLSRVTIQFSVEATDGIDTVKITGDNRLLFINRYVMSTIGEGMPTEFALHDNYPNPFNSTTTFRFDIPETNNITLTIYNLMGQSVKTFNMQNTPAGYHSITWDVTNDLGNSVGAGVYLYELKANNFTDTRKLILLK